MQLIRQDKFKMASFKGKVLPLIHNHYLHVMIQFLGKY